MWWSPRRIPWDIVESVGNVDTVIQTMLPETRLRVVENDGNWSLVVAKGVRTGWTELSNTSGLSI